MAAYFLNVRWIIVSSFLLLCNLEITAEPPISIKNKNIPVVIASEINEALQNFPLLAETKIDFVFKDNIKNSFMLAQPKIGSLLKKKQNRTYVVYISPVFHLSGESVAVQDLPKEVLVGWIGHELGHIMDYLNKSSISLLGFGFSYLTSKKFKGNAERTADLFAIDHGLGQHIFEVKQFIFHNGSMSEKYLSKIDLFYMSSEEVLEIMGTQAKIPEALED